MNVLVTGSHGLVGRALWARLAGRGDRATALVHCDAGTELHDGALAWDPGQGTIDRDGLATAGPFDAIVHLAGAGIGERRWTPQRKALLTESRITATELLAETLAGLDPPPPVMVSASAVGWYGSRSHEVLTEASGPGTGFLASLCTGWEAATAAAEAAGCRVVHLRSGVVLDGSGGLLRQLLPVFRLGLGGRIGSGKQWMSWISLEDHVSVILAAIDDATLSGPLNATAPEPATNIEFTKALGRALHRPAVVAVPREVLSLAMGKDLATELLFASQRVVPQKLVDRGVEFAHGDIDDALAWAVRRR